MDKASLLSSHVKSTRRILGRPKDFDVTRLRVIALIEQMRACTCLNTCSKRPPHPLRVVQTATFGLPNLEVFFHVNVSSRRSRTTCRLRLLPYIAHIVIETTQRGIIDHFAACFRLIAFLCDLIGSLTVSFIFNIILETS